MGTADNQMGSGLPPTRAINAPPPQQRDFKDYSAAELMALANSRNTAPAGQPPSFDFRDIGLGPGMGTIKDGQIYYPPGAITANGNHAIYIGAGANGESAVSAVPNHQGNFISNALNFKASEGKGFLKDLWHDPSRAITGIDPFSTNMWNKALGTHNTPLVDQMGGATQQRYKDAEAQGIDTHAGKTTEAIAHAIASYYGGAALGSLAGGAMSAGGGVAPALTADTAAGLGTAATLTPAEIAAAGGGGMTGLGGAATTGLGGAAGGAMQTVVIPGVTGGLAGSAAGGVAGGVAGGLAGAGGLTTGTTPSGSSQPTDNPGTDDVQTVEVRRQRLGGIHPDTAGSLAGGIVPKIPLENAVPADPVSMDPPKVDEPPKGIEKSAWEKLSPVAKKLLPKLLSAGIPAAAAIGMATHGEGTSGGTADTSNLIGKQTAVGDDLGKKMEDLYPQLKNSLANANASATSSAANLNGYAKDANWQADHLQEKFNNVIDPQLQQSLKDNAAFTTSATASEQANAARMSSLAGEQSGLWNNYTKGRAQDTLNKSGEAADLLTSVANKQVGQLGGQADDLQSQWKNYMFPTLQGQLEKGAVAADKATAQYNDLASADGHMRTGLQDNIDLAKPLLSQLQQGALNYNTAGNTERMAGLALGDVHSQFGAQRQAELQKMQSYGIDPTSGRYIGQDTATGNNEAAAGAAAASRARDAAIQLGWQKSLDANSAISSANNGYSTYANLSSVQGNNIRGGLDAQTQQYNNTLNLNNATNSNAAAVQGALAGQRAAGQSGMDAQSQQLANYGRFSDMADKYASGQVSISGAQNNALATGSGIQKDGFNNIATTNSVYDNNNAAVLQGKTTAGGLTNQANGILANNVDTNGNAIKTVAGAAGTQANIYGNAGAQANDIYRTDKAGRAAELGGLGNFAGSFLGSKTGQGLVKDGVNGLWDYFSGGDGKATPADVAQN